MPPRTWIGSNQDRANSPATEQAPHPRLDGIQCTGLSGTPIAQLARGRRGTSGQRRRADILVRSNLRTLPGSENTHVPQSAPPCCGQECPRAYWVTASPCLVHYGERHKVPEFTKLLPKRRSEMCPLCNIQRAVANTVIRPFKGNHPGLARREHRGLERRLHRLEARVAENRLAGDRRRAPPVDFGLWTLDFGLPHPSLERDSAQLPRQLRLKRVWVHVAHCMEQPCHLPLSGPDNARIGVPGRRHPKGAGQIQVLLPLGIPDVHAPGPLPDDGPRPVRFNERNIA